MPGGVAEVTGGIEGLAHGWKVWLAPTPVACPYSCVAEPAYSRTLDRTTPRRRTESLPPLSTAWPRRLHSPATSTAMTRTCTADESALIGADHGCLRETC